MAAVVAAGHATCPAQLLAVVGCDRMSVTGVNVVHADAVAAVFASRTVAVAAITEVNAHMGATSRRAEEEQITRPLDVDYIV